MLIVKHSLNHKAIGNKLSKIFVTTFMYAPVERVFDLSRSIDLHKISTSHTNENAIAGKLINALFLKNYLQRLLIKRNAVITDFAETQKWKLILH